MKERMWIEVQLLAPNRAKAAWLDETCRAFQQALERGLARAQAAGARSREDVRHLVYPVAREYGLSAVSSRLVVTRVLSARRHGWERLPRERTFWLGGNAYQLLQQTQRWYLRLLDGQGQPRMFPLIVPPVYAAAIGRVRGDARLEQRRGKWFLHLPLPAPAATNDAQHRRTWIGVDLGIARLVAVAAPDRSLVVRGASLQRRRRRRRVRRWMRALNHQVASRVVRLAAGYPAAGLALENLDGLFRQRERSQRFAKMRAAWDFPHLVRCLLVKAARAGVAVVFVDPRGSSYTCPRCRAAHPSNADRRGRFTCQRCGYQGNADLVAAANLAQRASHAEG